MIGKVFSVMTLISLIFTVFTGRWEALSMAVLDGADAAVKLSISLCGAMCFWNGVMEVLRAHGAIKFFTRIISPVISRFFPDAYRDGEDGGKEEISACIAANLLGIGNAATPLAISAMKKLYGAAIRRKESAGTASRDMITLAVLNTASANLLPTTIITLRRAASSSSPFAVVVPIWICSFSSAALALILSAAFGMKKGEKNGSA